MDKPWFRLSPNDFKDRWWLYTSIIDTKSASIVKHDINILCYLIIQDYDKRGIFYRVLTWFKNDPNRYLYIKYDDDWIFDKPLKYMNVGEIVQTHNNKFKVYDCAFLTPLQKEFCKILERIEE
jgi:hypothetical protein